MPASKSEIFFLPNKQLFVHIEYHIILRFKLAFEHGRNDGTVPFMKNRTLVLFELTAGNGRAITILSVLQKKNKEVTRSAGMVVIQ